MLDPLTLITAVIATVFGSLLTLGIQKWVQTTKRRDAESEGERILTLARGEVANLKDRAALEAKEAAMMIKSQAEKEISEARENLRNDKRKLQQKHEQLVAHEESLRKQARGLENTQQRLTAQLETVGKQRLQLESAAKEQVSALQEVSGLTREEAVSRLMENLQQELEQEVGTIVLRHERRVTEIADSKAREILLTALQRYASAHTAESTTSTVDIPTDDMKGRIIGREGRNIRSFEKATGVDVIIDDTPGVVIVSGFDPVRREIGRMSLNKLIADGRIHPSRIEEVVEATQKEIDAFIVTKGQEAIEEVNIPGLPPKVVQMLGRLHFRTSYSQNVLRHSVEVAFISGMLAEMIGLDGDLARHCGLLHDIGKAADHELEGGHPKIGADLLKRHNQPPEVVHAAFGHHDEIITEYPYTMLVATADACSASRPGARRESLERYVKRMEELESIATGFAGVQQAFAIQAGRELRVIVSAQQTDDAKAAVICRNIAKAFEQQLTFPGEIKVTVVRESRFTEVAH